MTFPVSQHPTIYVIHENEEWMLPLRDAFEKQKIPYIEWFVNTGSVDLSEVPPNGVFYNRMSASSHTRDHRYAVELSEPLLAWLEAHGSRVVNGRRALQLEVRKFEQYLALQQFDVKVPQTIAATGREAILSAAKRLNQLPFIVKPNRGGKGQGVQLFNTLEELEQTISTGEELSLDGIALVQEYIRPANGNITRMEFINGKFYYAVEVDATDGFELCPADACVVGDAFCPAPGSVGTAVAEKKKFRIVQNFADGGLAAKLERFFRANGIEVAAAEFVEDKQGNRFVYDLNMNTNYNLQAEHDADNGLSAMSQLAKFLGTELNNIR